MRIYLDDNRADRTLVGLLQKAGHSVFRPTDVGLPGASDVRHLEYAIRDDRAVLTSDREDFEDLQQLILTAGGRHPGILVVHYDNDPKRDMKPRHVTAAVAKLEASGLSLVNQLIILNQWR